MPIKITVGLCKKAGLRDYGSVGATCHVEFEADVSLLNDDAAKLQQCVARVYDKCRRSVDEELTRHRNEKQARHGSSDRNGTPRPATESQIRTIDSICRRQEVDVTEQLQARFGVTRVEDLDIRQASQMIDSLKAQNQFAGAT